MLLRSIAVAVLVSPACAQKLPHVDGVESQPVLAHAVRVHTALSHIGASLPAAVVAQIQELQDERP